MAGPLDPFTPGIETPNPAAFLEDPASRAALLSAGLAMMQPPSFGDTPAAQIARAIGAGGQAVGNIEAMDIKRQEADSKADLRSSQATAAEARAGAAGARTEAAGARLALQGEQLKALQERNLLGNKVRLSGMYQRYVADVAKRNSEAQIFNPTKPPEPILPINDWIQQNPMLKDLGLIPSGGVPDDTSNVTTPTPTPTPGQETLPPAAAQKLREGVVTTFGNGQKWTLRGGVPTRVP